MADVTLDDLYENRPKYGVRDKKAETPSADTTLEDLYPTGQSPDTGFKETRSSKNARSSAERAMAFGIPALTTAATTITGGALPTLGLASRLIPFAKRLLDTGGSVGGEAINQGIGLSDSGNAGLGVSAVAPHIGSLVSSGLQNAPRLLPGSNAAIRAGLVGQGRDAANVIRAADPGPLYDKLKTMPSQGTQITSMKNLQKGLNELRYQTENIPFDELRAKVKESGLHRLVDQMDQYIQPQNPVTSKIAPTVGGKPLPAAGLPKMGTQTTPGKPAGMNFNEIQETTSALGKLIRSTTDPGMRGAYRKLYGATLQDLEAAPAPPGTTVGLWKEARGAYRQMMGKNALADAIEKKGIHTVEGVEQFKAKPVLDWIKSDKNFRKQVGESTYRDITKSLQFLDSETAKRNNKFFSILIGAAAGGMGEHPLGSAGGAAMGYAGADIISAALLNPTASRLLTKWVTNPSGIGGQESMQIMAAALAGALQ